MSKHASEFSGLPVEAADENALLRAALAEAQQRIAALEAKADLDGVTPLPGAADRGLKVLIAGAGGAAHLPGMAASMTHLPVLGVPVESKALSGLDSLLSIVQMPGGVPVGTLAIGKAGAINGALLAVSILALGDPALAERLRDWRRQQTESVAEDPE